MSIRCRVKKINEDGPFTGTFPLQNAKLELHHFSKAGQSSLRAFGRRLFRQFEADLRRRSKAKVASRYDSVVLESISFRFVGGPDVSVK